MKLASNVKPLPKFFSRFYFKGLTLVPFKRIYLRKEIYDDLKSESPSLQSISVLKHEEVHLKRADLLRIFKWLSPGFRLEEELIAYKEQFKFLKMNNSTYDLDNVAKHLPRIKYQEAKKLLNKIWRES